MKFKFLTSAMAVLFVLFSFSCSNKTGDGSSATDSIAVSTTDQTTTPSVKKYDIKSAIVTYATETMGMKNSQKLYFDDYGAKERTETITEMEMMGVKVRNVTVSLIKDGYKYDYDLEKTTNKENNVVKEVRKSKVLSVASADMSSMAATLTDEMKKEYNYKDEGTETVAGKTGTKFSMKMGETKFTGVIYKKVMLKTQMEIVNITAEKFEEDASIPAETFDLPKDYKIIEVK
jgi:ribosomal protein L14